MQVAADPRGGWVIVMSGPRVRGLSLDQAGHRLGPTQDLGAGGFGFDSRQTQALAVDRDGRAVFAFVRADGFGGGAAVVSTRPRGGAFTQPAPVPGPATEPRVALGPRGRAVLAVTRTESCSETGCFGAPAITVLDPPLSRGRALALWATSRSIGAALAGPDGRFHATAAPAGPPPGGGHINPTNRDLHTAGLGMPSSPGTATVA